MFCVVCKRPALPSNSIELLCAKNHSMHVACGKGWIEMWRKDGQPPSCPVCKHLTLQTQPCRQIDIYLDTTCSHCTDFDSAVGNTPGANDVLKLGFNRVVCSPCKETDTLFLHGFQTSCATGIREYVGSTKQALLFCKKAGLETAWHESVR